MQDQVESDAGERKGERAEPLRLPPWALRAGRAAAGVSADELADASRLAVNTIRRAEKDGLARMSVNNLEALHAAFAKLGVVFDVGPTGDVRVGLRGSGPPVD